MTEKKAWISHLRVFALICVIIIHVSAPSVQLFYPPLENYWWVANIYDSFSRASVPLFIMITGALLLSREITLKTFLKKRFLRIIPPFLFWSFAYVVLNHFLYLSDITIIRDQYIGFIAHLFSGPIDFHLWYVYLLICLILLIPILNKWILNSTEKDILYVLIIWGIILLIKSDFVDKHLYDNLKLSYFSFFPGYLVLGYYLANSAKFNMLNKITSIKRKEVYLSVLFILTWGITVYATYSASLQKGSLDEYYYEYISINIVFASIFLFLLFKNIHIKNPHLTKLIQAFDKYSYGIYLAHLIVLRVIFYYWLSWSEPMPYSTLIGIPLVTIIILCGSFILVYLVNKIPFIGKYISG